MKRIAMILAVVNFLLGLHAARGASRRSVRFVQLSQEEKARIFMGTITGDEKSVKKELKKAAERVFGCPTPSGTWGSSP